MGMSTHVTFYRKLPAREKDLITIKELCDAKHISYPKEVTEYLNAIGREGSDIHLSKEALEVTYEDVKKIGQACCVEVKESGRSGYDVFIDQLPKDITIVRFFNSW